MRTPLRRKVLLYSSSLLIVLIVTMLVFVNYQAERFVDEKIAEDIQKGRDRILEAEADRIQSLKLTAGALATLSNFYSVLQLRDVPTLRDSMSYALEKAPDTTLFIALDPRGNVLARTDMPEADPVATDIDSGILKTVSATYHVAKMPVDSTGTLFGYVMAGAIIDDKFATAIRNSTNDDIVIIDDMVLGSSLGRNVLPAQTRGYWDTAVGNDGMSRTITVGNQEYEALGVRLGGNEATGPLAVIMQSRTRALAPYVGIQIGLLVLGVIAAVVGVAMSAVLARNVTAPVAKLVEGTQQVAAGNFDYRIDVREGDEIGDLARSFNTMMQGLRERADMQKFVSLSTVEMIQSTQSKKVSAGEKVTLTIFFSDMRGFTSMTENRPPEDTVKLLNTCLSLQAAKVKKFHGDIDKFVGDCVVALFEGEDMELNAIRCAVETHRALDELNASKPGEAPVRVGIGIVTGEVILGSIGSEDRLDYTIIGSNVNLCSRLCSKAGPGETLLAESTYERVKGLVAAEKIEPLQVKGFTDPIPVYKMG